MKKLFAFVLSTAMLFSLLTGCGGGGASSSQPAPSSSAPQSEASGGSEAAPASSAPEESTPEAAPAGGTIGVCIYKFDDAFMTTYRNALQKILEDKGYTVTVVDGNNDQAKQNEQP